MKRKSVNLRCLYDVMIDRRRVDSLTGTGALSKLCDDIEKNGLKYPLTVMLPHGKRSGGKWYRVMDGSLRLAALKLLQRQGKIREKNFLVPCFEIETLDEQKQRQFRANKCMSHPEYADFDDGEKKRLHETVAKGLFPYQREMIKELVAKGRLKLDEPEFKGGRMFFMSTPKGNDDSLKAYYDFANQQAEHRRKIAEEFARHGQTVVFDESSPLPAYAARDTEYSRYLSDTWKRQAEDRVHRPGPTKMVYVDFENQTMETFHNQRPVIVNIDVSKLTDEVVMANLKAKKAMFAASQAAYEAGAAFASADFASFEIRYAEALYTNGVLTGEVRTRAYDLGENW